MTDRSGPFLELPEVAVETESPTLDIFRALYSSVSHVLESNVLIASTSQPTGKSAGPEVVIPDAEAIADVLKSFCSPNEDPFEPSKMEIKLMQRLLETQHDLQKAERRLEIFESYPLPTVGYLRQSEGECRAECYDDATIERYLASAKSPSDKVFDEITSAISGHNGLSSNLTHRGSLQMSVGKLLATDCSVIPIFEKSGDDGITMESFAETMDGIQGTTKDLKEDFMEADRKFICEGNANAQETFGDGKHVNMRQSASVAKVPLLRTPAGMNGYDTSSSIVDCISGDAGRSKDVSTYDGNDAGVGSVQFELCDSEKEELLVLRAEARNAASTFVRHTMEMQILRDKIERLHLDLGSANAIVEKYRSTVSLNSPSHSPRSIHSPRSLVNSQHSVTASSRANEYSIPESDHEPQESQRILRTVSSDGRSPRSPRSPRSVSKSPLRASPRINGVESEKSPRKAGDESDQRDLVDVQAFATLQRKLNRTTLDLERYQRENRRMSDVIKTLEERVRIGIDAQIKTQEQWDRCQDELGAAIMHREDLERELKEEKHTKIDIRNTAEEIEALQRSIVTKDAEMAAFKVEMTAYRNQREHLVAAEKVIEALESKYEDMSAEVEHNRLTLRQLDKYKEEVREKTRENRELMLRLKTLDRQKAELVEAKTHAEEIKAKEQELKAQMQRIPVILADVARLRGSSRAAVRALVGQDASTIDMKSKLTEAEQSIRTLQTENDTLRHLRVRLHDADEEILRLQQIAGGVAAKLFAEDLPDLRRSMDSTVSGHSPPLSARSAYSGHSGFSGYDNLHAHAGKNAFTTRGRAARGLASPGSQRRRTYKPMSPQFTSPTRSNNQSPYISDNQSPFVSATSTRSNSPLASRRQSSPSKKIMSLRTRDNAAPPLRQMSSMPEISKNMTASTDFDGNPIIKTQSDDNNASPPISSRVSSRKNDAQSILPIRNGSDSTDKRVVGGGADGYEAQSNSERSTKPRPSVPGQISGDQASDTNTVSQSDSETGAEAEAKMPSWKRLSIHARRNSMQSQNKANQEMTLNHVDNSESGDNIDIHRSRSDSKSVAFTLKPPEESGVNPPSTRSSLKGFFGEVDELSVQTNELNMKGGEHTS